MLCMSKTKFSLFASCYFIGFFFGFILFVLPDRIGRKGTMNIIMPLYIISTYFGVYGQSIEQISFSYLFQGFLHVKIMLSYTFMLELTDDKNKVFCSTFLNLGDIFVNFSAQGLYYYYIDKNVIEYNRITYSIFSICIILFLILIPESPRWLFLVDRHDDAINALNYIAWFNRSNKRIPHDAQFDFFDQAVAQQ